MTGKDQNHAPLQPHVADRLLDLLSSDDDFRQRFQQNPAAAIRQLQDPATAQERKDAAITRTPLAKPILRGDMFYCMTAKNLASKEEIAQAREELKSYLTQYTNHSVVHCFEAGKISSALRLK